MKQTAANAFEATHFTLFAGMGGLSLGLTNGCARVGNTSMRLRCLGGVDVWPAAMRDFQRLTGSPGTALDLFTADDYRTYHATEPPPGWREATPDDLRRAAGGEFPDILATSPPCKGFSGLLNPTSAALPKYQALNRLTVRGIALALDAFADDPPSLVLLENVPRIQTRGRELLDTIVGLLRSHGYAVAETTHDCGELGGLAQHRRRFLLVARHTRKVRPFLYEPPRRRVRGIGEVLADLPMPDASHAGPMHRLPSLTWQTWVRLALIPAGRDWRALHDLAVQDGHLRDLGIAPSAEWHAGVLGVRRWQQPACTVTGESLPFNGAHAVADPRCADAGSYQPYGVVRWDEPGRTVTAQSLPGGGPYTVADPRMDRAPGDSAANHNNVFRIVKWTEACRAVTAGAGPQGGGLAVADPRCATSHVGKGKYRVSAFDEPSGTVIAESTTGNGAFAVADPRGVHLGEHSGKMAVQPWAEPARVVTGSDRVGSGAQCIADPRVLGDKARAGDWSNGGQYGVNGWADTSPTVTAWAKHDSGSWSVADPRVLPAATDRLQCLIVALDGTWHRPLTTMELAALQGYPVFGADGLPLTMDGRSDQQWRERIGNSVPVQAAAAIGTEVARTLLLETLGESFVLSAAPIWVQPFATALAVAGA